MAGVHECARASALPSPPPLRKAMLPGQSTHSESDTSWPRWETGAWPSQVPPSTGGTRSAVSRRPLYTAQLATFRVRGDPVSPRQMPKMGADGSSAPLGGGEGVCRGRHGTAGVSFCVSKQYCLDNWRSSPTHTCTLSLCYGFCTCSSPQWAWPYHCWEEAVTFLGAAWDPVPRWSFSSFSLLTSRTADIILWYLR